ncbi:MAG TPA: hypothetical protein VHK27_02555 [Gammaproteobacteria bacterium]|nr:hypothetical protein [Gammaproteobacteria bacterium]
MVQHVRLRVRILVKAFPQQSKKHEETVCCAGITEDGQQMLRLFPIRFRRLPKEQQFDRFDLVEVLATKAGDPRPESYRVDEASIQLIEKAKTLSEEAKVRLWQPFIASSLKALHEENRQKNRSLGIVRPDSGSIKFFCKPAKDADTEDRDVADAVQQVQQSSFLEDPLKPLEKPEYAFGYTFTSAGNPHKHIIHDWEVQAAYRHYKHRYGAQALERLKHEYAENIPARNLHFLMGTIAAHPRNFIIIGLLRSSLDPQELARQGQLL